MILAVLWAEITQYRLFTLRDSLLIKKQLISFFLIFLFAGCAKEYPYRYISLEKIPDIQVLDYGKTQIGSIESHKEMPVRYELKRKHYILFFDLVLQYQWPAVFIRSETLDGFNLKIEELKGGICGGFDNFFFKDQDPRENMYHWAPFWPRCPKETTALSQYQIILFRVVDEKGNILGEEKLPFSLIENGIYVVIDAI